MTVLPNTCTTVLPYTTPGTPGADVVLLLPEKTHMGCLIFTTPLVFLLLPRRKWPFGVTENRHTHPRFSFFFPAEKEGGGVPRDGFSAAPLENLHGVPIDIHTQGGRAILFTFFCHTQIEENIHENI